MCPMSLLSQWKTEVLSHTRIPASAVFCYYGSDRSVDRVADATVVLTTYGVVAAEYVISSLLNNLLFNFCVLYFYYEPESDFG